MWRQSLMQIKQLLLLSGRKYSSGLTGHMGLHKGPCRL